MSRRVTVKATKKTVYTLEIGGKKSEGWEVVSRWEGMAKLSKGGETVIVEIGRDFDGLSEIMADIFDPKGSTEKEGCDLLVIKASPSTLERMVEREGGSDEA